MSDFDTSDDPFADLARALGLDEEYADDVCGAVGQVCLEALKEGAKISFEKAADGQHHLILENGPVISRVEIRPYQPKMH